MNLTMLLETPQMGLEEGRETSNIHFKIMNEN